MEESRIKQIQNDLVQVTEPNPEEIAEIVKRIIDRTPLREFGSKSGLSASTLSRIINGKITKPLSLGTLLGIALCADGSSEDTNALLLELANANGMMSKAEQQLLQRHMLLRKQRDKVHEISKKLMSTVILAELAEHGANLYPPKSDDPFDSVGGYISNITEIGIRYDYHLEMSSKAERYAWIFWAFPQSDDDYSDGSFNPRALSSQLMKELSPIFLTDAWKPELYHEAKLTFCFADWMLFECFCNLLKDTTLNNRFSALLIDNESLCIKKERLFDSKRYPNCSSVFDLPRVMSITHDTDDATEEITGNDFLVYEE